MSIVPSSVMTRFPFDRLSRCVAGLLLLLLPGTVQATHLIGAEIHWDYLGSPAPGEHDYRIVVDLLADCGGTAFLISSPPNTPDGVSFNWQLGPNQSGDLPVMVSAGWDSVPIAQPFTDPPQAFPPGLDVQDVTPTCPRIRNGTLNVPVRCDPMAPSGALPGVSRFRYAATFRFRGNIADHYIARVQDCCRSGAQASQLTSPGMDFLCIQADLFQPTAGNSSPRFEGELTPFLYQNAPTSLSLGPSNPDGGTTNILLGPIFGRSGCEVYTPADYTGGLGPNTPLPTAQGGPLQVDAQTGTVSFTPTQQGFYSMGFFIEERDANGQLLSRIQRENIFVVIPSISTIATGQLPGVATVNASRPFPLEVVIRRQTSGGLLVDTLAGPGLPNPLPITAVAGEPLDIEVLVQDTGHTVTTAGDTLFNQVLIEPDLPAAMSSANLAAPSNYTAPPVQGTLTWVPPAPGNFGLNLRLLNDFCPLILTANLPIELTIIPPLALDPPTINVNCEEAALAANVRGGRPPYTYTWSGSGLAANPASGDSSLTHDFGGGGSFPISLSVTDSLGQTAQLSATVTTTARADTGAGLGPGQSLCAGQQLPIGSPAINNQTYTWSAVPSSGMAFLSDSSAAAPILSLPDTLGTDTFRLRREVARADGSCPQTNTLQLAVRDRPSASFAVNAPRQCIADNEFIFSNTSPSAGDPSVNFSWDFAGGQPPAASGTTPPGVTYASLGPRTVRLTAERAGCADTAANLIEVIAGLPPPEVQGDTVCRGAAASLAAANATGQVRWFDQPTGGTLLGSGPVLEFPEGRAASTTVYAEQRDAQCASPRRAARLGVYPPLPLTITAAPQTVDLPEARVQFELETDTARLAGLRWDFGDGATDSLLAPIHAYETEGVFDLRVRATDTNGCLTERLRRKAVEVRHPDAIFLPTAFTPNGDGLNDQFRMESRLVEEAKIHIHSRQGEEVFRSEAVDFAWDGKDTAGSALPEGTYVYRLEAVLLNGERRQRVGTVQLLR